MANGHKKITGMYCYKGNGCKSRFCEFCSNGDKYEEIEDKEIKDESYLENQYSTNETIKERIDKLIKTYQGYIDKNQTLIDFNNGVLLYRLEQRYEDYIELSARKIEELRKENELFRTFIESLEYAKIGERK